MCLKYISYISRKRFCDLAYKDIQSLNGIKLSHSDLNECIACLKPDQKVFLGSNNILFGALIQRIDSAIVASLNVFPELVLELFAAVEENRLADVQASV